jgi:glycerophosphoryl diester phosphodiesterase
VGVGALRFGVPARLLARRFDRLSVRCAQIPVRMANGAFLSKAHRAGLQVHVWTVNDPAAMARLLDLGADGIMTDETEALKDVLRARGQWHQGAEG